MDLARDAVDRQAVGPVGRDLELEHVGGDRQHVGQRRARATSVDGSSSTMIPSWSVPIATSSSARIIPSDATPRSLAALSCVPSGMTAPGRATATVWPAATFGAPQTIVRRLALADVDGADAQPVGVGVLLGLQHAADDEVLQRGDAVRARCGRPRCRSSPGASASSRGVQVRGRT